MVRDEVQLKLCNPLSDIVSSIGVVEYDPQWVSGHHLDAMRTA
jgi:hypothetical protein